MSKKVKPIRQPNIRVPGGKDYMIDPSPAALENGTHFYAYAEGDWGWVRMPTVELGPPGNVTFWGGRAELIAWLEQTLDAVRKAPAV